MAAGAATLPAEPAGAVCSVFDRHPCCSDRVQRLRPPALHPEIEYPIGQDLRLTIVTAPVTTDAKRDDASSDDEDRSECASTSSTASEPCSPRCAPAGCRRTRTKRGPGMQMSVRLALQAQRRDHRHAARDLCQPRRAARDARNLSTTPSPPRSNAARRCRSQRAGRRGRGPADRNPLCRQPEPAVIERRSHVDRRGAGDRRVCEQRGRAGATVAAQYPQGTRAACGPAGVRPARRSRGPACRSRSR